MQTFAALMDSIGSVMSLPGDGILTLETLAVLFRSELTRPRGAADPVLPVASNPDLWECDTERASVDPVAGTTMSGQFDDHALLNWGRLISRFQSWKWSTLAAAVVCLGANGTLASVGTDVIGDLLCTSLDAITVVPSDSVPSVVICQRELLVAYYSRREVSCEGLLAAVDGIMNTIAKVSLPIPLVKAISSLLFHIDLIRRYICAACESCIYVQSNCVLCTQTGAWTRIAVTWPSVHPKTGSPASIGRPNRYIRCLYCVSEHCACPFCECSCRGKGHHFHPCVCAVATMVVHV